MGDRISIQFKNGKDKSVVLFNHWGGMEFLEETQKYVKDLKKKLGKKRLKEGCYPIDRLEPEVVMVDFIHYLTKDMKLVESDLYLGKDENDGDNSDNGHHIIDLGEE